MNFNSQRSSLKLQYSIFHKTCYKYSKWL